MTLVALTMITTLVILAVTSNVVLSLGMVGALSIVRFRTAIKGPLDIALLFWSIAVGIVLAAGFVPLAVIGSVFIGLVLVFFVNRKPHVHPYILVLACDDQETENKARERLAGHVERTVVKSKTAQAGRILGTRVHTPRRKKTYPSKVSRPTLISQIEAKIGSGKGAAYDQKLKVVKLKSMAETLLFIQKHDFADFDALSDYADAASVRTKELTAKIKAAKKAFDDLALKKLPTVKSLQAEYQNSFFHPGGMPGRKYIPVINGFYDIARVSGQYFF